jgi:hypothetical protein
MRRCRPHRLTTQGGFRLIPVLSIDHNIRRFKAYMRRLGRLPGTVAFMRRTRLKRRIAAGEQQAKA